MRWFGHVQRRDSRYIGREMLEIELPGRRREEIHGFEKRGHTDGLREEDAEDGQIEKDDYLC